MGSRSLSPKKNGSQKSGIHKSNLIFQCIYTTTQRRKRFNKTNIPMIIVRNEHRGGITTKSQQQVMLSLTIMKSKLLQRRPSPSKRLKTALQSFLTPRRRPPAEIAT